MPLPFIVGAVAAKVVLAAAVGTGVVGAAKGIKGAVDTKEANDVQERAEDVLHQAQQLTSEQKQKTSNKIMSLGEKKIKVCSTSIADFVDGFSKIKNIDLQDSEGLVELGKVKFNSDTLKEMKGTALKATDVLGSGASGVGAGVLLGWGTYGGVMALGTASTGTAIGGLSGVAATNATLAWLGGGSLAAGGGGMALGSVVLGGLVAGPALLVAGGVFGAKAKAKLNNAHSNLSEARKISKELELARTELIQIGSTAKRMKNLLNSLNKRFVVSIDAMNDIVELKKDWTLFDEHEKNSVLACVKLAQAVKLVIDTPMLSESGSIQFEAIELLNNPPN